MGVNVTPCKIVLSKTLVKLRGKIAIVDQAGDVLLQQTLEARMKKYGEIYTKGSRNKEERK